eukprot:TRINITY_DN1301_c0_g1_i2.p1 TRINITY_DN1301_c0_g1~~TRINITY_DN1301_c0_g1_i2.p1  ORF type:complete len:203 (+),score=52.63 TRINITY_DN1301_c0_g1_i2:136-744(+)
MVTTKEMCVYCFDTLVGHFTDIDTATPEFQNDRYPLFVSWHKHSTKNKEEHNLRGCKGTFSALKLHEGLAEFSIVSAFKDSRFKPMEFSEITRLSCSVNLLFQFEEVPSVYDWEIGTHGIIIDFVDPKSGRKRNATYLPKVAPEQEWDKDETLHSLIEKAGYSGKVTKELLASIKLTRYQSSELSMKYDEYQVIKKTSAKTK